MGRVVMNGLLTSAAGSFHWRRSERERRERGGRGNENREGGERCDRRGEGKERERMRGEKNASDTVNLVGAKLFTQSGLLHVTSAYATFSHFMVMVKNTEIERDRQWESIILYTDGI